MEKIGLYYDIFDTKVGNYEDYFTNFEILIHKGEIITDVCGDCVYQMTRIRVKGMGGRNGRQL